MSFLRRYKLRALAALLIALIALAVASCGGGGGGGDGDDDLDTELQELMERMVLAEEDLPAGLERVSIAFSTNEDLAEAKGEPEEELEKLERQGRRLGIEANFLPGQDMPPDFTLKGGVQATVSLYETADGASDSFREGVEGVSQPDLAASYPDLDDVEVEELDRKVGDESVWFRITGISDAGAILIDDQVAFRVGSARSFFRAVSTFDEDAGRDAYLEEIAALTEAAAGRIEQTLPSP